MPSSISAKHLKRYKDIALLLIKYGHGDLIHSDEIIDDPLPHAPPPGEFPKANELANDFEKLGPTFIKLGQLISTRADMVPAPYREALSRLQDKVQTFPFDEVEAIVEVEIGAKISRAFKEFDSTPLAAASLGQVHHAVLRSGKEVIVKVQRPHIREVVFEDLEAMAEIASLLDDKTDFGRRLELSKIVEELRKSLMRELDYRLEAANLKLMREKLAEFENILIPASIDDYSTGRVLTMEYVSGFKITRLNPATRLDVDGAALAEELFRAYLHQILVMGVFHADPHPGNVFLTDDHQIALLDLGMVARVGPSTQNSLMRLLLAVSEGQSDRAAEIAQKMGTEKEDFDEGRFRREIADLVSQQQSASINDMQVGKMVMDINRIAGESGLSVPSELTMLGKTLLNLDLVGRTLCPDFDPNESIRRNSVKLMQERTLKSLSPGNIYNTLLEVREFVEKLPRRLNELLDLVAGNKLKVKVDTIDETVLLRGLEKVANRIALGLILAALIMGASMLMRVETTFRIFGYPGLAMILFLIASAGGIALAIEILWNDRRKG